MMNLFDTAPSFDTPIDVAEHCHARIVKVLTTMGRLSPYLVANGPDEEAQIAIQSILNYFQNAAPLHHADEEEDIFPQLLQHLPPNLQPSIRETIAKLNQEHLRMAELWNTIEQQLLALQQNTLHHFPDETWQAFILAYQQHLIIESETIFPMAKTWIPPLVLKEIGRHMQQRRNIIN